MWNSFVQSQRTESDSAAQRPDDCELYFMIVKVLWGEVKGWAQLSGVTLHKVGGGTQEGDLGDMSREHLGHQVIPWSPGNTRTHRANE